MSRLNPIIRGWSNYYSTVVSKETFNKVDSLTYDKLRAWARRRGKGNINKDKYWRKVGDRNWCFSTEEGRELARHSETPITRHVKVKGNSTAYDGDWIYWSKRRGEYPETPIIVATVLKTQKGKCIHCGLYFTPTDIVEVDHIQPRSLGGKDEYKNLQLLHKHCHDTKTENDGSLNRNYYSNPFWICILKKGWRYQGAEWSESFTFRSEWEVGVEMPLSTLTRQKKLILNRARGYRLHLFLACDRLFSKPDLSFKAGV